MYVGSLNSQRMAVASNRST